MKDKKTAKDFFPIISKELLDALDSIYPEQCHSTDLSYNEMCRRTGRREVVRFLHQIHKQQTDAYEIL